VAVESEEEAEQADVAYGVVDVAHGVEYGAGQCCFEDCCVEVGEAMNDFVKYYYYYYYYYYYCELRD